MAELFLCASCTCGYYLGKATIQGVAIASFPGHVDNLFCFSTWPGNEARFGYSSSKYSILKRLVIMCTVYKMNHTPGESCLVVLRLYDVYTIPAVRVNLPVQDRYGPSMSGIDSKYHNTRLQYCA